MLCCTPGAWLAAASAMVSNTRVLTATMQKRRSTIANGCGSIRYDHVSSAMTSSTIAEVLICVHHQVSDSRPCPMAPTTAAT